MWSDLSDQDLIDAAKRRSKNGQSLPLDMIAEFFLRGLDPHPYL